MKRRGIPNAAARAVAAILSLALSTACATLGGDRGYWMASHAKPAAEGARLALAPINFRDALPYPLAPRLEIIESELEQFLIERRIQPLRIQDRGFDELWHEASQRVGSLAGISQELQRERYDAAMGHTVVALSERSPDAFDGLVVATVVYREAVVDGLDARWDRVSRALQTSNPPAARPAKLSLPGPIEGLSLRVEVYGRDGTRVFESYGGLELPERLDLSTNQTVPRRDALVDTDKIREALSLALGPYVPSATR